MKFQQMFSDIKKGNFGLTEQAIYKSIQNGGEFIPIWGGNKNHDSTERLISVNGKTKKNNSITIFEGEGIIISLDGSAGSMTYKENQKFALNHHAGFFKVIKPNLIIPEFFALFYENQLKEKSVSEGSKTLTQNQIFQMDFEIPDIKIQEKIMNSIQSILKTKNELQKLSIRIEKIKSLILAIDYTKFQVEGYPITSLLDCISGNTGLIEKIIYQKIPLVGDRYTVLSSSTESWTKLGEIPKCEIDGKEIKVFKNTEGILIVRNGKAGTSFYLEKGKYTINDHAYILSLKDSPFEVSLKWLMYNLKSDFLEYSSSSDNGTWNKTGFYENIFVNIPTLKKQLNVLTQYEQMEKIEKKIKGSLNQISCIFEKQIITHIAKT